MQNKKMLELESARYNGKPEHMFYWLGLVGVITAAGGGIAAALLPETVAYLCAIVATGVIILTLAGWLSIRANKREAKELKL